MNRLLLLIAALTVLATSCGKQEYETINGPDVQYLLEYQLTGNSNVAEDLVYARIGGEDTLSMVNRGWEYSLIVRPGFRAKIYAKTGSIGSPLIVSIYKNSELVASDTGLEATATHTM